MHIVEKKLVELLPYAKNAKKHDETQIANVAESIRQFGFVQPLVIDKNGCVIIGHCRLEAAKKLGMESVPCVLADTLTDEQVKALRIIDNKANESPWDMELLTEELPGLKLDGFDFDFDLDFGLDTGDSEDEPVPDFDLEDNAESENKQHDTTIICPKCGFEWVKK